MPHKDYKYIIVFTERLKGKKKENFIKYLNKSERVLCYIH